MTTRQPAAIRPPMRRPQQTGSREFDDGDDGNRPFPLSPGPGTDPTRTYRVVVADNPRNPSLSDSLRMQRAAAPVYGRRYSRSSHDFRPVERVPVPDATVLGPAKGVDSGHGETSNLDYRVTVDRNASGVSAAVVGTLKRAGCAMSTGGILHEPSGPIRVLT